MIGRAYISAHSRVGVEYLGRGLQEAGAEIVSWGTSAEALAEAGIKFTPVASHVLPGELPVHVRKLADTDQARRNALAGRIAHRMRPAPSALKDRTRIDMAYVGLEPVRTVELDDGIHGIQVDEPGLAVIAAATAGRRIILSTPTQIDNFVDKLGRPGYEPEKDIDYLRQLTNVALGNAENHMRAARHFTFQ